MARTTQLPCIQFTDPHGFEYVSQYVPETKDAHSYWPPFSEKVSFTSKTSWTEARWPSIRIQNTSATIETVWNSIIAWIDKNFTETIKKIRCQ